MPRPQGAFSTRLLMVCAAIGVAGGIVSLPMVWATVAVYTIPLAHAPIIGLWAVTPVIAMTLLRRPGVGVLTALILGIVNMLNPIGWFFVGAMACTGVLVELPFALTRYRLWHPSLFYIGAVLGSSAHGIGLFMASGLRSYNPGFQVLVVAVVLASTLGFCRAARWVAGRLRQAGVANGVRADIVDGTVHG